MGQQVQPHQAKEAAQQFESGHVCRSCESQLLRLPGGEYHWCPTCGVETHSNITDICACGSHVGKHDAQMRCAPSDKWQNELNPLLRRKVQVVVKPQAVQQPVRLKASKPELFEEDDQE
jgi:predicted amidophosphoribosyltransferase